MAEHTCGAGIHIKNCAGGLDTEQVGLRDGLNYDPPPIYILKY